MVNQSSQRLPRIALVIFLILFLIYGYFHQGGGWNQNSRFNQVRAIVETQQLAINQFLLYRSTVDTFGAINLTRLELPIDVTLGTLPASVNSADVSLFAGNIFPNKPPGTVFLALPAYGVIYGIGALVGADADDWWILTINAYLTTVFSVGLVTALGGVFFYLVSIRLFPESPKWTPIASTLTYGLGTLILPFATLLFDHNLVASLTIAAFWLLVAERQGGFVSLRSSLATLLIGGLCGLSITVNYTASIVVSGLFFYGVQQSRHKARFVIYWLAGALGPLLLLAFYHWVCFGSAFATANTYQFGDFQSDSAALFGMFSAPALSVMAQLLFSSYRGLFFSSPALLIALWGLCDMARRRQQVADALLIGGIFAAYWLLNASINHWEAGWSVGPRYLIPAIPFLALTLTPMFQRWRRTTISLAVLSVAIMIGVTAIDPQPPSTTKNPLRDHVLAIANDTPLAINHVRFDRPLSANPIGSYESWLAPAAPFKASERKWHSFNLGEFIWPGSFWSLVPLTVILGLGGLILRNYARPDSVATAIEGS